MTETGIVKQARDVSDFEVGAAADAPGWLEVRRGKERIFLPQGAAAPDLSRYVLGRPDAQPPAAASRVMLDLAGLAAWQSGDSLQLVSPNAGMVFTGVEQGFAAGAGAGVTALFGESIDWKGARVPLVDAARGDTTWVTQLAHRPLAAGSYYQALAAAGVAKGFAVRDGGDATLAAQLAPVAQDRALALRWRGSQFAALAAQAGPHTQPAHAPSIAVRALPDVLAKSGGSFRRAFTGLPSLVEVGPISGERDLSQDLAYGNPFSSKGTRWTELVTLVYAMPAAIPTPDGVATLSAMVVAARPADAGGELAPVLSPVRGAKLDGQPLDAARAGSASPVVSWEAPAVGAPTGYAVTVHGLSGSRTGVRVAKLATFYTKGTQLQLPASVAQEARSYVVTITAIAAPGADLTVRPFVGSLPYAATDYVSARISNSEAGQ